MTPTRAQILAVLRAHDWRFARTEAGLSSGDRSPVGWRHALPLPADCAKPRTLYSGGERVLADEWTASATELLTDALAPWMLTYTRDAPFRNLPDLARAAVMAFVRFDANPSEKTRALYKDALIKAIDADREEKEAA